MKIAGENSGSVESANKALNKRNSSFCWRTRISIHQLAIVDLDLACVCFLHVSPALFLSFLARYETQVAGASFSPKAVA